MRRSADSKRQHSIVVLGGYGAVGMAACKVLGERFPGRVLAAGRSQSKAESFSSSTGGKVLPLQTDLANPRDVSRALDRAKVVVACAGTDDVGLARRCMELGVHYVDISASYAFLKEVGRLNSLAEGRDSTTVLSVGLAPGLTNLLARHCKDTLGAIEVLDIYVLLGMGEDHGEAAVRWTLENLDSSFLAPTAGGSQEVHSLEDPKATIFPSKYGRRTAYRFDFSDQHNVSQTLGIGDVATRLCLDPAIVTRLLAALKQTGLLRMLKHPAIQDPLVRLLTKYRLGSEGFAVKAEAQGTSGHTFACSVYGRGESRATGIVAALVAEELYETPSKDYGVFHLDQLFDPPSFLGRVSDHGFTVDLGPLQKQKPHVANDVSRKQLSPEGEQR